MVQSQSLQIIPNKPTYEIYGWGKQAELLSKDTVKGGSSETSSDSGKPLINRGEIIEPCKLQLSKQFDFDSLSVGNYHAIIYKFGCQSAYCFGYNHSYQCGLESTNEDLKVEVLTTPSPLPKLDDDLTSVP
eukprot:UN34154